MNIYTETNECILENEYLKIKLNKDNGTYSILDKVRGLSCIQDAFARVDGFLVGYYDEENKDNERKCFNKYQHRIHGGYDYLIYDQQRWRTRVGDIPFNNRKVQYPLRKMVTTIESKENIFGKGQSIVVKCERTGAPTVMLTLTVYEGKKFVTMQCSLDNTTDHAYMLREFHPLSGAGLFTELENKKEVRTLDGLSGNGVTHVSEGPLIQSSNNILMTFEHDEKRYSVTVGGLAYHHFAKYFCIDRRDCIEQKGKFRSAVCDDKEFGEEKLDCMSYDPHGLRVEPGQSYESDMFYLDFITEDPFESLEQYATLLQKHNDVHVNTYQFPIVNCWYVSNKNYSQGQQINNTPATIKEMEMAKATGFFKYAPVAIQLEPDKYHGDTEQGWWDDEHFVKHKHYQAPYDTTKKWCEKLEEIGAIPYFYMQSGLPSDDFAKEYPHFMLNKDISMIHHNHDHHQTYVTFDYTNKEFQDYLKMKWGKLAEDGLKGVKFDYPESVWRTQGGFDDKYATSAKAYRIFFKTAREAFGPDMMINERNLGESYRPVVDVTLGYVDTQRVWNDASSFVPQMVTKAGLRWYKNRVIYNYDIEAKTFYNKNKETGEFASLEPYKLQSLLTMNYVVSGRLLMATSFTMMTPDMVYDMGRIFPIHEEQRMARPIDAFTGVADPQVYDYKVNDKWHQLTLYNTTEETNKIEVYLGDKAYNCGLELDPKEKYHLYDFWSDRYLGIYDGTATFSQELLSEEAKMISVHQQEDHPQFISTNRHVMQGYVDLKEVAYDSEIKTLSGIAAVVEDEAYEIVIVLNGHILDTAKCVGSVAYKVLQTEHKDIIKLQILSSEKKDVNWKIEFK